MEDNLSRYSCEVCGDHECRSCDYEREDDDIRMTNHSWTDEGL